jgi:diaminopimelate decarboxylase
MEKTTIQQAQQERQSIVAKRFSRCQTAALSDKIRCCRVDASIQRRHPTGIPYRGPPVTESRAGFFRLDGQLFCDGVPLAAIAESEGTPLYVYSAEVIRERCRAFSEAFAGHPHCIHYALKANSTLAIARLLRDMGVGVDANSVGEIEVALRAGFAPSQIVFTGVGKTRAELERAIRVGVGTINAESAGELQRISAIARGLGSVARVAIRVNPDIDSRSHPHITTGLRSNKFGVPIADARELYRLIRDDEAVRPVGIHVHVGSQILSVEPLARAASALVQLAREIGDDGVPIEHLDLGGGLGVSYDGSRAPTAAEYAACLVPIVRESGLRLLLEPGRVLLAPAGVLVATVVDTKGEREGKRFAVLDAGMTELMRPALYGAFHRIEPVVERAGTPGPVDVVGPVCESSDIFGKDRLLPPLEVDDMVAVFDAGAYGAVMASNYNRRPFPAEAMVEGGAWRLIRRRQQIDDMVALED